MLNIDCAVYMYIDSANYFCASSPEYNLVLYVINVSGYIFFRAIYQVGCSALKRIVMISRGHIWRD